jgi:DNA-binding response OmpR family regulator
MRVLVVEDEIRLTEDVADALREELRRIGEAGDSAGGEST